MIFIFLAIALAVAYILLQSFYLYHWRKTTTLIPPKEYRPSTPLSIIIVAHNESATIGNCIRSVLQQKFPEHLYEIIVVDDRSSDNTKQIVESIDAPGIRFFALSDYPEFIHPPAYKKSGIELGVLQAKYDFIVTADADCVYRQWWLLSISHAVESLDPVFITAPIYKEAKNNFLEKMQEMENLALMVVTAGGIHSHLHDIANGANMIFSKKAFGDVQGYDGNYHHASGDDMFLIEKMRRYNSAGVYFLKSFLTVAVTKSKASWRSLIQQRIRWAGKNKSLQSQTINRIWLFVGLYHLAIIASLGFAFVPSVTIIPFIILFIPKWIMDFIMVQSASFFINRKPFHGNTIILQFIYTFYIIRLGLDMVFGKKGDWA